METREMMWLESMKYYGLTEVVGSLHNPVIVNWFKELGHPEIKDDETPWCSLAMNIMAKRCNLAMSNALDARSWMKVGSLVTEPKIGHITVFWRGKQVGGWQGHVGLFAGYNDTKSQIFTLGGNQGNSFQIRAYPVNSAEFGLLGFRELPK